MMEVFNNVDRLYIPHKVGYCNLANFERKLIIKKKLIMSFCFKRGSTIHVFCFFFSMFSIKSSKYLICNRILKQNSKSGFYLYIVIYKRIVYTINFIIYVRIWLCKLSMIVQIDICHFRTIPLKLFIYQSSIGNNVMCKVINIHSIIPK